MNYIKIILSNKETEVWKFWLGCLNILILIQWTGVRLIGLEEYKRIPKEWEWAKMVEEVFYLFFSKTAGKNAKNF